MPGALPQPDEWQCVQYVAGWHVGALRENLGFLSSAELCDLAQALHEVAGEALGELARRAQAGVQ